MNALVAWLLWNTACASAIAVAAWFVQRRLHHPAFAHVLWLLALIRLMAPPIVDGPFHLDAMDEPALSQSAEDTIPGLQLPLEGSTDERVVLASELVPSVPETHVDELPANATLAKETPADATTIWIAAWLLSAGLLFVRHMRRILRFASLLRLAERAPESLVARTESLASSMGLRRVPAVIVVTAPVSPMLFGAFGRARIVLPKRLLTTLNARQKDALLLHELAHWKRRDHWVRHVEFLVTTCFFWHPLARVIRKGLHESEEQCCDAWVTDLLPSERKSYANTLVDTLEFLSGTSTALPVLASGATSLPLMQRRLHMILHRSTRPATSRKARLALGALGLALIPIGPGLSQSRRAANPPQEPETIIETVLEAGQVLRVRHGDVDVEIRPTGDGNVKVIATRRPASDAPTVPELSFPRARDASPRANTGRSRSSAGATVDGPSVRGRNVVRPTGPSRGRDLVEPPGPSAPLPGAEPNRPRAPSRGRVPGPAVGTGRGAAGGGSGTAPRSRSNAATGGGRVLGADVIPGPSGGRTRRAAVGGRRDAAAGGTDVQPAGETAPEATPPIRSRRATRGNRGIDVAPEPSRGTRGGARIEVLETEPPPQPLPPSRADIMVRRTEEPASIGELVRARTNPR